MRDFLKLLGAGLLVAVCTVIAAGLAATLDAYRYLPGILLTLFLVFLVYWLLLSKRSPAQHGSDTDMPSAPKFDVGPAPAFESDSTQNTRGIGNRLEKTIVMPLGGFFSRGDSIAINDLRAGRNPAQSSGGGVQKLLPCFAVIVLPYLLIQFSGFPQWLSRPIVLAALICSASCYLCYWSINPNSRILGAGAKLNDPEYDQSRGKIILGIRGLSFIFGVVPIGYFGLPFAAISLRLAKGERPVSVSGTVLRNDSYRAAFFLGQNVTLSTKHGTVEYSLFYSPRVLRYGQDYTLIVMQGSNLVLDTTTR